MPPDDMTPNLKRGTIRIPEIVLFGSCNGAPLGRGPGVRRESRAKSCKDWTAEFLVKRNGPKWSHLVVVTLFAGLHLRDKDSQVIRIVNEWTSDRTIYGLDRGEAYGKGEMVWSRQIGDRFWGEEVALDSL